MPADEAARLARLRELAVLDTLPEPLFDELTRWAAASLGMPIALISLVDEHRQWFKSIVGLNVHETPRNIAFCAHSILQSTVMEVPDAQADPRFVDNPLVTDDPRVRFYAGAPIEMPGGERIGTLCVLDHEPRQLNDEQRGVLAQLARMTAQALLMRETATQAAWTSRSRLERELSDQAAALHQSERRFRELSELSPVGVFHTDRSARCTYTNHRWQTIYGLSAEQSIGNAWASRVHPDDLQRIHAVWSESADPARAHDMEFRVLRPGGELRHVKAKSQPVLSEDGSLTGHVGVVLDVTDEVALRRRLQASEAQLDRAGTMAGVGGWELDLVQQLPIWSDQTRRIHGAAPGFVPSLEEAINFYAPEARPVIEAAVQRCMSDGTPWDLELPLITVQGQRVWVRAQGEAEFRDGEPVRLFGAFQDITARRESEQRLERSRQALRVLYESSPAMLMSIDPDGLILTITDHCLRHFKLDRDSVVGMPVTDLLVAASANRWPEVLKPRLFGSGVVEREAASWRAGDGSTRDVLLSGVLDTDAEGHPLRALLVVDDITEELARRAELQREQQLRQQIEHHANELQRLLTERSEMLDVLAHEVRQPLNNASAALQSAASALHGKGERAASARMQRAQTVLGEVLAGVDNTLAAAALLVGSRELHLQDMDVDTLIDLVIADMPVDERPRIGVEMQTAQHSAPMDLSLLRLALRNLLANALRYSATGAPVLVRIIDDEDGPTHDRPAGLAIDVVDAGTGFDSVALSRLFERGGKGTRGGNGLGLHIARRVVDLHGGRLSLARNTADGSTLRMVLRR